MGVTGLQTYLRKHCPDACYEVDIPALVSNYRNRTGNRAEIVVDASACFSMWYEGLDYTIGMEVMGLLDRLTSFVTKFEEIGADLVFFFGSLTPEMKRDTWLRRRRSQLHRMLNVYDNLKKGRPFVSMPKELNSIPANMTTFVSCVLKYHLNCTVYVTVGECDEEIIQYVNDNNSCAIFSHDTDFVISQIDCDVLAADCYDSSEMTTLLYDRTELCRYLGITKEQLPLVAIMAGNDHIDVESLKPFHFEQCGEGPFKGHIPYNILFTTLGEFVTTLPHPDYSDTDDLMDTISVKVFDNYNMADELKAAYNSYLPIKRPSSLPYYNIVWSCVLNVAEERLRNVLLPVSAWSVLSRQVYECSACLEDLRVINDGNNDPTQLPSATITRDLRRRFYGVLLFEIRNWGPIVTEWCGENLNSYQKQESVTVLPEYPQAYHPGLRAMWDENRSDVHPQTKWVLFLSCISPRISNIGAWMSLHPALVVSTATCYYLFVEKNFLKAWELKTILATLGLHGHCQTCCADAMYDGHYDLRATQISVTYSRTYSLVFSLLASCGFPITEENAYMRFEAKVFQHVYQKAVNNKISVKELCEYKSCPIKTYHKIYDTIHG